jgi:hypothetical protein
MSVIVSTLQALAKILCVEDDQIEDALASERLAKRTLSRRGLLLGASAAVAAAALPTGLVMVEKPSVVLVETITLSTCPAFMGALYSSLYGGVAAAAYYSARRKAG